MLRRGPLACSLLYRRLQYYGILTIPDPATMFKTNKYRPCLQEYYADWAPEKLGNLDENLRKYEGREKQLFGLLQKKYKQKVQTAKCS